VNAQHGVVSRRQLLELGFTERAIRHRLANGRLHLVFADVYAVGRPQLTRYGRWMAAVLSCGEGAALSHACGAALWEIRPEPRGPIEVSVPIGRRPRRAGIVVHRRKALTDGEVTEHQGITVTTPIATLIDIAPALTRDQLEAAINEADKRGLADPDQLRSALDEVVRRPGTAVLRDILDSRTFTLTDSTLERAFLRLAREAGLPTPLTQHFVNGYRVDFFWPEYQLVIETDGLTYHRTPAQQAKDLVRDQAHTAAGLTALRFSHAQVSREPDQVRSTLRAVARRHR
jgi:very-short-patch-repair endonuclease